MLGLKIIFIYLLIAVAVYFFLTLYINKQTKEELEEADAEMENKVTIVCSLIWPITLVIILYEKLMEVFKNGRN